MINLPLFAFLTGLHFALLQFSYVLLLQINISSTYLTYAIVVMSWMAGTMIGLWWERLEASGGVIIGLLSYYSVYALLINDPFSTLALPVSAVGVGVTGVWAGRFFVVMLPLFKRADILFFHENNGFLLGIVSVFLGFTLLGRPFMLWTPLISAAALLLHIRWIARHQHRKEGSGPMFARTN